MANKKTKKSASKAASSDENVVRIKAGSSSNKKTDKTEAVATPTVVKAESASRRTAKVNKVRTNTGVRGFGWLGPVWAYFKGAWVELRQVRWPNRRATWSLTGAVLAFSAFFVVFVLLLDALFKFMFDFILKK